jgi:hypothetical protein
MDMVGKMYKIFMVFGNIQYGTVPSFLRRLILYCAHGPYSCAVITDLEGLPEHMLIYCKDCTYRLAWVTTQDAP